MVNLNIGFVFIHGAGLGSWIWDSIIKSIDAPCLAIDLPGRAHGATKGLTLKEYTNSVLADIDEFAPKKIIIVAHSVGGIMGLEVAKLRPDRIAGFVAVGAILPKDNQSFISTMPFLNRIILNLIISLFGTRPSDKAIRDGLCNDLSKAQTQKVVQQFVPESRKLFKTTIRRDTELINPLYILLTNDNELSLDMQRQMAKNLPAQTVDLHSGHLPMIGSPKELSSILHKYAEQMSRRV